MYDDAGFLTLSILSAIAMLASLGALLWAAVQDGRDEQRFRAGRG